MAQTAAAIVKNGDSGKWRENCEAECSNRVALYLRVAGGDGREGEGSGCVRKGIEAGPKESQLKCLWFGLVIQWLKLCHPPTQGAQFHPWSGSVRSHRPLSQKYPHKIEAIM